MGVKRDVNKGHREGVIKAVHDRQRSVSETN